MQGGAHGVDICHWAGFALVLFGRRVALGTDHGALLPGLEGFGNAEVYQHNMPVRIDHHVGGFHIPEDDRLGLNVVQVVQYIAQLDGPLDDLLLG